MITVDRDLLQKRPDKGAAVLQPAGRAAAAPTPRLLAKKITPCAPKVPAPCSTGEPYAAGPGRDQGADRRSCSPISEHREQFPGVAVQTVTQPTYPGGSLAAHVLGYTGDVTAADVKANTNLNDADTIGAHRARGSSTTPCCAASTARRTCCSTRRATRSAIGSTVAPTQGDTLVTSIDARVQALAESSLAQQIKDSRKAGQAGDLGQSS